VKAQQGGWDSPTTGINEFPVADAVERMEEHG